MYHTVARQPTLTADVTPLRIAGSVIFTGPSDASTGVPEGSKNGQRIMISTMNLRTNFSANMVLERLARARKSRRKINASRTAREARLESKNASTLVRITAIILILGSSRCRKVFLSAYRSTNAGVSPPALF